MSVFRALVVDDDEWVRKTGRETNDPGAGIEVLVAKTKEEAAELIGSNFLHVAVVDLELRKSPRALAEGQLVLSGLKSDRPSCRRLLLTRHATTFPEQVFETLRPDGPTVDGAIDKANLSGYFHGYLKSLAAAWTTAPVEITNLDNIYALLETKGIRGGALLGKFPVEATRDELRFVLASLFGQRYRWHDDPPDPDDVEKVSLEPLLGGKSRSIVLYGRPLNRLREEGLLCVVKVGPRLEAEEELRRYEKYVRFRLSLRRRVELLGSAIGDTLGAIAYSFAGEDPADIGDLQTLIDSEDRGAFAHFHALYDDGGHGRTSDDRGGDLGEFFRRAYRIKPFDIRQRIQSFADDQAEANEWQHRGDELRVSGGKLVLPSEDTIGMGLLHMGYRSTVVHGDLNASNVIIGNDNRSILIDYRHTARGPRALDLAAMHASLRISRTAQGQPAEQAAKDEALEYRLWEHNWSSDEAWWPAQAATDPPYWLQGAAELMRVAAERLPDLTQAEHAATLWLYALRVFRVQSLEPEAKLRLLIWMSALQRVLVAEAEKPTPAADPPPRR
ncbi:MAG: phosphotransferase [Solirubrobacterales bacterium]